MTEPHLRLRPDAVTWTVTDEGVVALDLRTSKYLSMNASATPLWRLLDGGCTRADLVAGLVAEFGITTDVAGVDVDAFLAHVTRLDLVTQGA